MTGLVAEVAAGASGAAGDAADIGDVGLRSPGGDGLNGHALGNLVLWAGSADDLIKDATSRSRFRLALDCADRAFLVGSSNDEVERLTTIWDLEGAEPVTGVVAA